MTSKNEPERLQKFLARAGVASRREAENLIAQGRVMVGGRQAVLGSCLCPGEEVLVDGRAICPAPSSLRLLLYHKPEGEIVTCADPQGRPTVFSRLPKLQAGRWIAVGRLDVNASGLLLFTNDGDFAQRLSHPRYAFLRVYRVRALGMFDESKRKKLLRGVVIDGKTACFSTLEGPRGTGANRWYEAAIAEGRNHEVKNLFASVGLWVNRLVRVRFGPFILPTDLLPGQVREFPGTPLMRLKKRLGRGLER